MYNLRTIPEIHPYEKIIRTLRISGLDDKFVGFVDANLKNDLKIIFSGVNWRVKLRTSLIEECL